VNFARLSSAFSCFLMLLGEFASDTPRTKLLAIKKIAKLEFFKFQPVRTSNQGAGSSNQSGRTDKYNKFRCWREADYLVNCADKNQLLRRCHEGASLDPDATKRRDNVA
jgi:hypothetical protein